MCKVTSQVIVRLQCQSPHIDMPPRLFERLKRLIFNASCGRIYIPWVIEVQNNRICRNFIESREFHDSMLFGYVRTVGRRRFPES
jgi:hypothetical protein